MSILVTGGCGFIGSHIAVELLLANYDVVIIDNLTNSKNDVIEKIKQLTNKELTFYQGNVQDKTLLENIFKKHNISAVIHLAGYKSVGESVKMPIQYYRNNIESTLVLCEVMQKFGVKNLVFSSSATVYGNPKELPIKETSPIAHATNPYGETKIIIERILNDLYISDNAWNIALLRYFNPIGAHQSGLIGENPNDIPNNLMPYIIKVALNEFAELSIFGNDYDTPDGTGIRDYIHVVDLAKGHLKALEWVLNQNGIDAFNLGTGKGYSVLELVNTFKKVNNVNIPYKIVQRRDGDVAICYADINYAKEKLKWQAQFSIDEMVRDAYNFAVRYNNSNR